VIKSIIVAGIVFFGGVAAFGADAPAKEVKKAKHSREVPVCKDGSNFQMLPDGTICLGEDLKASFQNLYQYLIQLKSQVDVLTMQNELLTKEVMQLRAIINQARAQK
jgi:hypothetical protein